MSRQSEKNAEMARLRHDLRNHLQVMDALLERGETGRAGAYALDVVGRLRAAEGWPAGGAREWRAAMIAVAYAASVLSLVLLGAVSVRFWLASGGLSPCGVWHVWGIR